MTQITEDQFAASLSAFLDEFEPILKKKAIADNPYTTQVAHHVIDGGGKRFRPAMVYTAAQCGSHIDRQRLISAALVMELTHVASLYHDDVMDEAMVRRGQPSANAVYGNSVAIMVGDFLFAQASSEVATLGVDYVALQAQTFAELVQGQIAETIGSSEGEDHLEHYLSVIYGKTASLIRTAAVFGAMTSGADQSVIDALGRYGEQIGMVFQLSDDIIDIVSDSTGKTPGTDLREGVSTLPTLLLRASEKDEDRRLVEMIDAGLDDDDQLAKVVSALRSHPVIDEARAEVQRRADIARSYLVDLPDNQAREWLDRVCDEMVSRSA